MMSLEENFNMQTIENPIMNENVSRNQLISICNTFRSAYLVSETKETLTAYFALYQKTLCRRGRIVVCDSHICKRFEGNNEEVEHVSYLRKVAIKEIPSKYLKGHTKHSSSFFRNPYNEVSIMQSFGSENPKNGPIMCCLEALRDQDYLYIVMPLCGYANLWDHIPWEKGTLCALGGIFSDPRKMVIELLEHLQFLCGKSITLGNISPENIIVHSLPSIDHNPRFQFVDLENAILVHDVGQKVPHRNCRSVDRYTPPELRNMQSGEMYNPVAADTWCLGATIFAMLTGWHLRHHIFDNEFESMVMDESILRWENEAIYEREQLLREKLTEAMNEPDVARLDDIERIVAIRNIQPTYRIILHQMLRRNPEERYSAQDLLSLIIND